MKKTATIQARLTPATKDSAQKVLDKLNISMSEAISIFLTQVTLHNGIPFDVKIPNSLTEETLLKSEEGKAIHVVKNKKQLLRELDD